MSHSKGVIEQYHAYLPIKPGCQIITLQEGNTPLVEAPRLAKALGAPHISLYLKLEGLNPTGSFKDRGMTLAVTDAVAQGSKTIISASTGNTSASAAAYAARAGIKCVVLIPDGNIALGKLSQGLMYGAQVLAIQGNFDDALELVKEISRQYPITMVNSLNEMRIEGQKTGAFEIVDALEDAPDYQFMPVGNAGNITAYWKGYCEYFKKKKINSYPKLMGFQAEGAAPIVQGKPIKNPSTIATAIKIGNPASWKRAEAARDESGGVIDSVTDDEILEAYKLMAQLEGVYCEPASAAGVAGLKKYISQGKISLTPQSKVVAIITGHGLKDPDRAIAVMPRPLSVKADVKSILDVLHI
ncbi:MAG: Threonine synthase [Elusimicrobia bacterium]|nr:Threonine synthase [Elusimicrobiota bacterium]